MADAAPEGGTSRRRSRQRTTSGGVQLAGRNDALLAVRAGPQQLQVRLPGSLGVFDPDRVLPAGLELDGALVESRLVRGVVVDTTLPSTHTFTVSSEIVRNVCG